MAIFLYIAATINDEISQINVKTAFLNGYLEQYIYMEQPEGFKEQDQEQKVCKLLKSIYGLKQASRSWNLRFVETIKIYWYEQNVYETCAYKLINNGSIVFLVLYIGDILQNLNEMLKLSEVQIWLAE